MTYNHDEILKRLYYWIEEQDQDDLKDLMEEVHGFNGKYVVSCEKLYRGIHVPNDRTLEYRNFVSWTNVLNIAKIFALKYTDNEIIDRRIYEIENVKAVSVPLIMKDLIANQNYISFDAYELLGFECFDNVIEWFDSYKNENEYIYKFTTEENYTITNEDIENINKEIKQCKQSQN